MRAFDVRLTDILNCPVKSFRASHYRPGGTCLCHAPRHSESEPHDVVYAVEWVGPDLILARGWNCLGDAVAVFPDASRAADADIAAWLAEWFIRRQADEFGSAGDVELSFSMSIAADLLQQAAQTVAHAADTDPRPETPAGTQGKE